MGKPKITCISRTCDVWFDGTNKKRKRKDVIEIDPDEHILNRQLYNWHPIKRPRDGTTQYEVFRNVRCGQLRGPGRAAPPRRCHSCNGSETPEWRRGPDGARTLCNACGLRKSEYLFMTLFVNNLADYAKLTRKMVNKA